MDLLTQSLAFSDSSDEDEESTSPFTFDHTRNVLVIRSPQGNITEVPMDSNSMQSFVRSAAVVIKTQDIAPRLEQQKSEKITATDVALYDADDDDLVKNTLISDFCDEMLGTDNSRKYVNSKKASVIHGTVFFLTVFFLPFILCGIVIYFLFVSICSGVFKLASPRFQSRQQLHLSDKLRMDRASQRNLEELSKFGIGTSRKALQRLLQVQHCQNDDYSRETLIAAGCYGEKVISSAHDNLQWADLGLYIHSVTAAVIILDLYELHASYTEHWGKKCFNGLFHIHFQK